MLPNEDRSHSKGRDAQFELFVAAVCQNAGLHPVAREEPDVTCHIEGIKFGIAAKRIKSVTNLKKHVRKAAQQIEGAGFPGMIALDTNVAFCLMQLKRKSQRKEDYDYSQPGYYAVTICTQGRSCRIICTG